jgi:hypothetical protein
MTPLYIGMLISPWYRAVSFDHWELPHKSNHRR